MVSYFESMSISQSQLKLLLGDNPGLFNTIQEPERYFEEKEHFIIGSAVDCLLTTPSRFATDYYVSTLESKPTDVIKSILKQVYDKVYDLEWGTVRNLESYSSFILEACRDHSFGGSMWSDGIKLHKILEHRSYFNELRSSRDKTILSVEEKTLIDSIVMSLKTNEVTSKYFMKCDLYQVPLYFTYEDVECKALLDMVIIDEENKTIQPIDIKTVGTDTLKFHSSLKKRRYDIQAAFYTEALKRKLPQLGYAYYTILPFKFLVESTKNPGNPLVYTCTEDLLEIGKYGLSESYSVGAVSTSGDLAFINKNEKVLGFHDLIMLYKYYMLNGFNNNKKIVESNSELLINWHGIV